MRMRNHRDSDSDNDIGWLAFVVGVGLIGMAVLIFKARIFLPVTDMVGSACSAGSWVRGVDGMIFLGDVILIGAVVGCGPLINRWLSEDQSDSGPQREFSDDGWDKPLAGVTLLGVAGALLTFGGWLAVQRIHSACVSGLWSGAVVQFLVGVV